MGIALIDLILEVESRLDVELPTASLRRDPELRVSTLYGLVADQWYGVVPPGEPPVQDPMWHRLVAVLGGHGIPSDHVRWDLSLVAALKGR